MKDLNIIEAVGLQSPNPLYLACTKREDGTTNVAPLCFVTILSFKPPMLGFMFGGKNLTTARLKETGKIVLALPGKSLAEQVMACGKSHGFTNDKVAEQKIPMKNIPDTDISVPEDTRLIYECSLVEARQIGDHLFHICNIDQILGDETVEGLHAWEGFSKVAPAIMG